MLVAEALAVSVELLREPRDRPGVMVELVFKIIIEPGLIFIMVAVVVGEVAPPAVAAMVVVVLVVMRVPVCLEALIREAGAVALSTRTAKMEAMEVAE